MIINLPTKQILSDVAVTNISQSFKHNMASKTSWHRYVTKLCHCHPMYSRMHPFNNPSSVTTWVSRYQKGKNNLDFAAARDNEWQ